MSTHVKKFTKKGEKGKHAETKGILMNTTKLCWDKNILIIKIYPWRYPKQIPIECQARPSEKMISTKDNTNRHSRRVLRATNNDMSRIMFVHMDKESITKRSTCCSQFIRQKWTHKITSIWYISTLRAWIKIWEDGENFFLNQLTYIRIPRNHQKKVSNISTHIKCLQDKENRQCTPKVNSMAKKHYTVSSKYQQAKAEPKSYSRSPIRGDQTFYEPRKLINQPVRR